MGEDLSGDSLPKIIIIVSAQRHGTTTLCKKFNEIESCISFFEAFNKRGIFYLKDPLKVRVDQYMVKIFKEKNLTKKHTVVFKIFPGHKVNIEDILKLKTDISFIFLKRKLSEAYKSYKKAILTGNWGTTPELQAKWSAPKKQGYTGKCIKFNRYKNRIENWMEENYKIASSYKLKTYTLFFKDVISKEFNPKIFI